MPKQERLDLSRFDPEAPQLDLLIDPAVEGQGAVGIPGNQIPRSIQTRPGS